MGCYVNIVVSEQGFCWRHGFLPHYVGCISCNRAVIESTHQSFLVHQMRSCRIDDQWFPRQVLEHLLTYDMPCISSQRRMKCDYIGISEKLLRTIGQY